MQTSSFSFLYLRPDDKDFFKFFFALIAANFLLGCKTNTATPADTLFELMPSKVTGITFTNTITTGDSLNVLSYEYLYNGGGVGIGDFNNDSLPDIFFSGNMVPCRIYINRGDFVFEDITEKSGIDTKGVWAYGVAVVDINQDGFQDIYLCSGGIKNITRDVSSNRLYINKGNLTFEESAAGYGLSAAGESIQSTFFDYDRDGDLDMYLMKGGGFEKSAITPYPIVKNGSSRNTDKLFRNDFDQSLGHPKFTDVSKEAGILIEGFGLGVSVIDVNRDAWPDIYVTNDYLAKDHLYVNNRNGTFTDQVDTYLKHMSHFAMGNDVADINNDGRMDIVALDMLPEDNYRRKLMFGPNQYDKFYFAVTQGYGYQYMRNTLQVANVDGSFSEIGQLAGIDKTNWSWAPLIADFDNDGFQDIVISNGYGKDVTNLDYVKYKQPSADLTLEERRRVLLDRPSITLENYAYKNNHDNTFTKVIKEWGFDIPSISSGMVYADFDLDGDLDLAVNNIDLEAFIYRNKLIEKKTPKTNYIRIVLAGQKLNNNALGASVSVKSPNLQQTRYVNPVRGFESTVENVLHFGLGGDSVVDTITVNWSDGKVSTVVNPSINNIVTLSYEGSREPDRPKQFSNKTILNKSNLIKYKHFENDFNDFVYQPLLAHKLSQEGPGIAVGDVNKDGLEDFFVGGCYRSPAHLMIQDANGNFVVKEFKQDFECEDLGALFFDADSDGDDDLYVVSGGVEFYVGHKNYQDRLYRNDGKGNFTRDNDALPSMPSSGSCVVGGDYDLDGDLDLFIGGRVLVNKYPQTSNSFILRNDNGKFVDVTAKVSYGLSEVGMVKAALWTDFDNDNSPDLIVAGEAMSIKMFKNTHGTFKDVSSAAGLDSTNGFWNSLVAGDFDNDGDTDYIAGNLGLNGPMHASKREPITINYADFDKNGSIEPIIGYYEEGINHPVYPLDILASRLPGLKKKIQYHKDYAASSMEDVIGLTANKEYGSLYCRLLQTSLLKNMGNGRFELSALPQQAQIAPIFGLLVEDVNSDGNVDVLGAGNFYAPEIVYGRYDALRGVTFLGDGKGGLNYLSNEKSGFTVDGDAKGMVRLETSKGSLIVVTQNNDSIKSFILKRPPGGKVVKVAANESSAVLYLKASRKRKIELGYGTTYLSQSSRSILINDQIDSLKIFRANGDLTRTLKFQ